LGDHVGERRRDRDGWISEADEYLVAVTGDVIDGEAGDPGQWRA
jgi:hypothetical protein